VFHLASFHHKISMKLRSDVNSLQSLSAGMHQVLPHSISIMIDIPSTLEGILNMSMLIEFAIYSIFLSLFHPCTGTEALYRPYGPEGE